MSDLAELFAVIRKLLHPSGFVFVQVPDLARKPCSLLLGDLHSHFTPSTLAGLFKSMGFAPTPLVETTFPRDVLMTAVVSADRQRGSAVSAEELDGAVKRIWALANGIAALPPSGRTAVLGTTIEAAFVESLLPDRIAYFVDENPSKVEAGFHGKAVYPPDAVSPGDLVVVPMGAAGVDICRRLTERYRGTYVSV